MFDAAHVRAAFPRGSEIRYRFEARGSPTVIEHWTWVASTSTVAVIEVEKLDAFGKQLSTPERGASSWEELANHGLFPKDKTIIEDTEVEVGMGRFRCKLYKVDSTDEQGEAIIRTFYFAADLPGPPIRFETWKKGERIFHAEMIARSPAPTRP
jgi:hypothetical protein